MPDVHDQPRTRHVARPRQTDGGDRHGRGRRVLGELTGLWSFWFAAVVLGAMAVLAVAPDAVLAVYPNLSDATDCRLERILDGIPGPSGSAWFGLSVQGCDYLTHTVVGARPALIMAFCAATGTLVLGAAVGLVAGWYRGAVDAVLNRLTELTLAIPAGLGMMVWLTTQGRRSILDIALAFSFFVWPTIARLVRAEVLALREAEFIHAALALGATDRRVLLRHVLPNALPPALAIWPVLAALAVSAEAAMSFLGLGLELPAISWGTMLNSGSRRILNQPHLLFFPGTLIVLTVAGLGALGESLRVVTDPRAGART